LLDALGNLGDFVGGLAVVITLIYLAIQVRQNTQHLEKASTLAGLQARDHAFEAFSRFRGHLIGDPDTADIYIKGLFETETLSRTERLRFNMLVQEFFYILDTSINKMIAIGEGTAEDLVRDLHLDSIVGAPGAQKWWAANKDVFRPEFITLVDTHVRTNAEGTRPDEALR